MSGPPSLMLPTSILPSSTYGEFREAGREVSRQRRRNVAQVRREHKARTRRVGMLPSIPGVSGSSQAEILSGPINSLTAHSSSSYGGRSPYPQNPSPILQGGAFIGTRWASLHLSNLLAVVLTLVTQLLCIVSDYVHDRVALCVRLCMLYRLNC